MRAYDITCAVCELRHGALLDAAHVIEDRYGGAASVKNGLALCKIHHAAYDANIMGISADHRIHIRHDVLHETDGPMLRHGLQDHDGRSLRAIPNQKRFQPDERGLAARFEEFQAASNQIV